MIKNISTSEIKNSKLLQKKFLNSYFEDLKINCNSYKGNFYLIHLITFLLMINIDLLKVYLAEIQI